ncbi:MAG: PadR family transcriptional regulator [Chloroflexota bacterium]
MAQPKTYTITYAVLGLLAHTGPRSGYDLKQIFDVALSTMWNATQKQIYSELTRVSDLGWAEMEKVSQENRPDKKVYKITAAGHQALRDWQATHPVKGLQLRDEVLLRFIFGATAAPDELAKTLFESMMEHESRKARYLSNARMLPTGLAPLDGEPKLPGQAPSDPFFVEATKFALKFEEMYIEWLKEAFEFVVEYAEKQNQASAEE